METRIAFWTSHTLQNEPSNFLQYFSNLSQFGFTITSLESPLEVFPTLLIQILYKYVVNNYFQHVCQHNIVNFQYICTSAKFRVGSSPILTCSDSHELSGIPATPSCKKLINQETNVYRQTRYLDYSRQFQRIKQHECGILYGDFQKSINFSFLGPTFPDFFLWACRECQAASENAKERKFLAIQSR